MATEWKFEWDEQKAESNFAKHRVPFDFATRVFFDPQSVAFDASRDADGEVRRKVVGVIQGQLYTVVFTPRGERTRIISCRRSNKREEDRYGSLFYARPE